MTELVMTEAGAIDHTSASTVSGGAFVITSQPSASTKVDGSGVYRGPLQYTFSGGDASGFINGSVTTTVPQVIQPTATKSKDDNLPLMRLGDSGPMVCVGTPSGGGSPVTVPNAFVEVADAGQDSTEAT
jgi:hypothetical protein